MAQDSWNRDADGAGCHQPDCPLPCSNNCGLFGSPSTFNFCSKCYQEFVLKPGTPFPPPSPSDLSVISSLGDKCLDSSPNLDSLPSPSPLLRILEDPLSNGPAACSHHGNLSPAASFSQQTEQIHRRNANRCLACRKRVGLLGFKCRCGDVFCSVHRYSEKHNCSFDYKAAGRDAIAKANPIVKADKVQKI